MAGLKINRPPVAGFGFGIFSLSLQYVAQIVVGVGILRIKVNDVPYRFSRFGMPVLLMADDTQVVQGVQVFGCGCDDFPVKALGRVQRSTPVELERKLQSFLRGKNYLAWRRTCGRRSRFAGFDIPTFILLRDVHMPIIQ